ncbi:uncharacterized protein YdcH (DUF465 family) [Klebsiella sp. BIGb0407]|nr:uncharacterized protein YdcH (DUF465 family) [Klebsiella sp. BIGb0407]
MSQSENDELIIELKSHKINDLIEQLNVNNMHFCSASEPYNNIEKYFKSRVSFLVVLDNEKIMGVVEKAHRRY